MGLKVCKTLYGSMQGAERLDAYKQEEKLTTKGFIRSCVESSLYFMPVSSIYGLVLNDMHSRGRLLDSM